MFGGFFLIFSIDPFFNDHLQPFDKVVKPTKPELLAELVKTINSLQIEEDSQTFAFRSFPIEEIYNKHIVLKNKFEFLSEDSPIGRPKRSRLFYDLILPFNNRKPPSGRCFEPKELPAFYRYLF